MTDVHDRLREFWDRDAHGYDRIPSHAASDPAEAAAWRAALSRALPPPGASVLDVGAGTGAVSLLAAQMGYRVTALDISERMLERAREKAGAQGLDVEFVVAASTEPPPGPFDAVVERHVLWTTPDPVAALGAWRRAAPGGRLVLFEGVWGREDPLSRLRGAATDILRGLHGVPHEHHAHYDPEVLAALPFARMPSPVPVVEAMAEAGWQRIRIARLRDVEWARRRASPLLLGWLESVPQYALIADDV